MKKFSLFFTVILLILAFCLTTSADGNVTYRGRSSGFIFEPGSSYSPTDLFTDFKNVMPGDTLTQKITVRNSGNTRVRIYMRALGAHEDSVEFLSQLRLNVKRDNTTLFNDSADASSTLNKWVLIGTFLPRTKVDLDVTLTVPTELDNYYSETVGYLDWEFIAEEIYDPSTPVYPEKKEGIDVTVTKVWQDSDRNKISPPEGAFVTVEILEGDNLRGTVTLSDANGWSYTFKNLPEKDAGGDPAVYSVREFFDGEGWETEITGDKDSGFVITNTKLEPQPEPIETVDVAVTKVWQDANGSVVEAPKDVFVTIALFGDDGSARTVILNESMGWTYLFKDLPKLDKNGNVINYSIAETTDNSLWNAMISGNAVDGFVIVNTLASTPDKPEETVDINVVIKWQDDKKNDIAPPEGAVVPVELKANGIPVAETQISESNGCEHTFSDMPLKDKDGNVIVYTIEGEYDDERWHSEITGDLQNGFVIINTLKPIETTDIKVTKLWKSNDGKTKDAPKGVSVTIELTANGITVDIVELSIASNWFFVFENMPLTDEYGNRIDYSIKEYFGDEGWVSEVSGDMENGFIVTNTEKEETPETPKTGDDSLMVIWQILAAISFFAILILVILLIISLKKREEN